jgi:hypothetical protein
MMWQQLLNDTLEVVSDGLEKALAGLSQADLNEQPHPDCNSMGWLAWHLTRTQDRAIASVIGEDQIWIKEKWYAKFDRAPDPSDSGFSHKSEDVAGFKSPDVEILLSYHKAVLKRSKQYIEKITEAELGRKMDHPKFSTVEAYLVAVLNDDLQHLGQIAYLRGLLKGKGWSNI